MNSPSKVVNVCVMLTTMTQQKAKVHSITGCMTAMGDPLTATKVTLQVSSGIVTFKHVRGDQNVFVALSGPRLAVIRMS